MSTISEGLKCFVTECKPTTACWKPSRQMAGWSGQNNLQIWLGSYHKLLAVAQRQNIFCNTKCMKALPICAIYWVLQISI